MLRAGAAIARRWGTVLVTLVCIACVGVGVGGWTQAHDLRDFEWAENQALVDQKATNTVARAVRRALSQVLSYDYRKPKATQRAADKFLAGDAREQFATLFASLQERAPKQQLLLSTSVQAVGVTYLTDEKAKLLVFLTQSSQRASDKEATYSAAQLAITAEKRDRGWTITGLKPL